MQRVSSMSNVSMPLCLRGWIIWNCYISYEFGVLFHFVRMYSDTNQQDWRLAMAMAVTCLTKVMSPRILTRWNAAFSIVWIAYVQAIRRFYRVMQQELCCRRICKKLLRNKNYVALLLIHAHGRCCSNYISITFKFIVQNSSLGGLWEIALRWMQ